MWIEIIGTICDEYDHRSPSHYACGKWLTETTFHTTKGTIINFRENEFEVVVGDHVVLIWDHDGTKTLTENPFLVVGRRPTKTLRII